jgi:hypothetical protein
MLYLGISHMLNNLIFSFGSKIFQRDFEHSTFIIEFYSFLKDDKFNQCSTVFLYVLYMFYIWSIIRNKNFQTYTFCLKYGQKVNAIDFIHACAFLQ